MKLYATSRRWHIVGHDSHGRLRCICGTVQKLLAAESIFDCPEPIPLHGLCRNCARLAGYLPRPA